MKEIEGFNMSEYILELNNITKRFPGVLALDDVQFDLKSGEVHVLMGENGAGKSTLMKILNGQYSHDDGVIKLREKEYTANNPKEAIDNGIAMIHQELSPILDMNVAENIFIGREPKKYGFVNKRKMFEDTEVLLDDLKVGIKPGDKMRNLSVAQMQIIEIAKAISYQADVIIMDEPTSALSDTEVSTLFGIINKLIKQNIGIIYISHKMDEIYRIADRITILRDGTFIGTYEASKLSRKKLISLMVGRELSNMYPVKTAPVEEIVLSVKNLSLKGVFENLSFDLRKGEILGVAGLMGSGRSEMVETIFGVRKATGGSIRFKGKEGLYKSPEHAISKGIALVTEDRKATGLNVKTSVQNDMTSVSLKNFCRFGQFIIRRKEVAAVDEYIKKLNIKTYGRKQIINNLSGGNQQKVIVARWLMADPTVFIIDEPTRGIDVGTKYEIYSIICDLAKQGKATLMVSSELEEIMGICDRTIVMHEGRITGEINRAEMTQERIMNLATATVDEENNHEG